MGQAALIVVGTVVGAYFGYPQLGFVLGSLAGNALFPTQLPGQFGPKLNDNQTTTSVIGAPVPILFGTAALSGAYMWTGPIVSTTTNATTGGKGGPEQSNTTFNYAQSVAVGLCEGPVGGVTRIWENGMLVYDIRVQQTGESDIDYGNRLTIAAVYAETFTLHLGDEDQVADATIEAVEGMGNVPGFRGLAYIVWPNRRLQESQGLRHPTFRFEVFEAGSLSCTDSSELSNDVLYPWESVTSADPRNPLGTYAYRFASTDYTTFDEALAASGCVDKMTGWSATADSFEPMAPHETLDPLLDEQEQLTLFYSTLPILRQSFDVLAKVTDFGGALFGLVNNGGSGFWWTGRYTDPVAGSGNVGSHGIYTVQPDHDGNIAQCYSDDGATFLGSVNCVPDSAILVTRKPGTPPDPCALLPAAPISGYCIRGDGLYIKAGNWTYDDTQTYVVLAPFNDSGSNFISQYPLNPCLLLSSPDNNETFWTAAYDAAVANGKMPSGLVYGTNYPIEPGHAWTIDLQVCTGGSSNVTLGYIIRKIAARCGLTDVDASDMDAVTVDGYAVATIAAGRDILAPLRSVGFFDCVESGSTLKFVARGKPIVKSLTADDFGAFDGASTDIPGPSITTAKAQDEDLPLQTRVHYFATSRDYEAGEQLSPTRQTTNAVNIADIELAVCMGDSQAAKIAEVIWSDAWAERWSGQLAVDQAHSELEPGDCIEVPVDSVTRRIRIVNETTASGVIRTLNYVRDDDTAYVSHAVAAPPQRKPQVLKPLGPTDLELLDLPALVDTDNDAGFYAAARGASGTWNGCIVYKSSDGGTTFAQLGSIVTPTTMGVLHAAVPSSDWHTWDDATQIVVDVAAGVTFESRTDAAVLTGANTAAMGANGRWEIVQFANATQLSATQWQLSRLLRGRRGTEYNIGSSATADKFIMISGGTMLRVSLQTSEIGASRVYKAVSIGTSYATGIDQTFTGRAVALKPFSPVFLTAERETSGDILLSWIRRGRLGRTWMSGVDIPLSEATEAYQVDVYSLDSPHAIVRTISVTAAQAVYTAAQQSTDFGSDSADHVMVAVYQMSATVGRGTPDVEILTLA